MTDTDPEHEVGDVEGPTNCFVQAPRTNSYEKGICDAEQSNWKDSTENHSIAELVSHLTFWNEAFLKDINGEDLSDFDMENELTFKIYSEKEWKSAVSKLDSIQTEFERITEKANEEQLSELAPDILTMTAHNAYHTGQIIYIRKRKGWWNK